MRGKDSRCRSTDGSSFPASASASIFASFVFSLFFFSDFLTAKTASEAIAAVVKRDSDAPLNLKYNLSSLKVTAF